MISYHTDKLELYNWRLPHTMQSVRSSVRAHVLPHPKPTSRFIRMRIKLYNYNYFRGRLKQLEKQ